MAFFVILISSYSSEESVGTSTARVILFGTIPTTLPSTAPTANLPITHDDTPLIPTDTPTISPVSDSSSETLSDSHSNTSIDSSSSQSSLGHAISNSPCDLPVATFVGSSRKRLHADLSPPPKRIRDSDLVTDLEVSSEDGYEPYIPREVGLGVDVEDSYKPYTEPDVDFDIQADIDECIAYADAIRARGTDDRDVVV
ncbi:hypothetical protein Tco_1130672 [Tanacetum coccineum]